MTKLKVGNGVNFKLYKSMKYGTLGTNVNVNLIVKYLLSMFLRRGEFIKYFHHLLVEFRKFLKYMSVKCAQ